MISENICTNLFWNKQRIIICQSHTRSHTVEYFTVQLNTVFYLVTNTTTVCICILSRDILIFDEICYALVVLLEAPLFKVCNAASCWVGSTLHRNKERSLATTKHKMAHVAFSPHRTEKSPHDSRENLYQQTPKSTFCIDNVDVAYPKYIYNNTNWKVLTNRANIKLSIS